MAGVGEGAEFTYVGQAAVRVTFFSATMPAAYNWPDPDPHSGAPPMVDDVSRMNAQEVDRIFSVRTKEDIQYVLALARKQGKAVSMRGTRHSMGAQTIAKSGFVIDLMRLNQWKFDLGSETIVTQPGALWSDLIEGLNEWGYSPRTMQSYSTFSVGGSLAVNAHGITTDYCLAESVLSFRLIKWDGSEVLCSREAAGEGRELFSLALGGYGLFGVIHEVTLKVSLNVRLSMEMIQLSVAEFPEMYAAAIADEDGDIDVKMARLDVTDMEHIDLFIFRRDQHSGTRTVSTLASEPHRMPLRQQILYKWILPQLKEARYAVERAAGKAIDIEASSERNVLMFESAEPLARLYSPLFAMDDTFVLQEYFVPRDAFVAWVAAARPAYALAARLDQIELLNTTVRFVHKDDDTALAYSRAEGGAFAFVLYYRVHRNEEADEQLSQVHTLLSQAALRLGGCFYLPYRHHYSDEEFDAAYPNAAHFFGKKQQYDPHCLFRSAWYDRFGARFWDGDLVAAAVDVSDAFAAAEQLPPPTAWGETRPSSEGAFPAGGDGEVPSAIISHVAERRQDSYRRLLRDHTLRPSFRDQFLTKIFNIEDPAALYNMIAKVARNPRNASDLDCFVQLKELLAGSEASPAAAAQRAWKQVRQLKAQKVELVRETGSLLSQLGRLGTLTGYVSMGDHGKMVLEYQRALGLKGKVWVVHDVNADADTSTGSEGRDGVDVPGGGMPPKLSHIPSHQGTSAKSSAEVAAVLERGSASRVGEYVYIDYQRIDPLSGIPDCACDLVTMHQGLHHLPQPRLAAFLREVHRVLRPSGLLLVREHDASPNLVPMLDMAHSIFNAVTGVSAAEEAAEIRAFRPVLEWRKLIESAGFRDTMVYEMEKGDPTRDEMMCFVKPCPSSSPPPPPLQLHANSPLPLPPALPAQLSLLLDSGPPALLDFLRMAQRTLATTLPQLERFVLRQLDGLTEADAPPMLTAERVRSILEPLKAVVARFGPVLEHAQPLRGLAALLPLEEIALLVRTLLRKDEEGRLSETESMAATAIKDVLAALGITATVAEDRAAGASAQTQPSSSEEEGSGVPMGVPHPITSSLDAGATSATSTSVSPPGATAAKDAQHRAKAIDGLLRRILLAKPELGQPNALERAGFPPRAVSVVYAQLDGVGDVAAVAHALARKLDNRAIEELRAAAEGLIERDTPPLSYNGTGGILEQGSAWNMAATAVLGAPQVAFTSSAQTMATFVGLGPIIQLWRTAQQRRQSRQSPQEAPAREARTRVRALSSQKADELRRALESLRDQRYRVSITVDDSAFRPAPIQHVKQIWSATYREQRQSEEPWEIECTAEVTKALLEAEDRDVSGGQRSGNVLHLHGPRVDKLLRSLDVIPRHPSAPRRGYKFGDLTRRTFRAMDGLVETALERSTRRILSVEFSTSPEHSPEPEPAEYLPRVKALIGLLDDQGALRSLHHDDGEFTWFKLNEWMQVEIIEVFGASLSQAAWYRFPYMEMCAMYFRTLLKEATIVQQRHGFRKAWLSSAAMYDIVPGILMAFYFSQLHLLGAPLRAMWGSGTTAEDYAKEHTGDKAPVEELLLRTGPKEPDWAAIDARIFDVCRLLPELYTVAVPTFKPLTEILRKLSEFPELEVLSISNQGQVQVRIQVFGEGQLVALGEKKGVEVMFDYQFPVDGTGQTPPTSASLCVEVPYLLSVMRFCRSINIDVMQVYDFWC